MSQQDLLRRVVETLERAGVDYMLTGSFVSSLQGEPRATHDIDVVVAMDKAAVRTLVDAFPPPEFYLNEEAAYSAIATQGMFNLIAITEGDKVDFWLLTEDPFDQSRFSRKSVEEVLGISLSVPSPEDTVLAKLKWTKESGGSEKHFVDALRVYEVQGVTIDHAYVDEWAKRLSVEDLWQRIRREAEPL